MTKLSQLSRVTSTDTGDDIYLVRGGQSKAAHVGHIVDLVKDVVRLEKTGSYTVLNTDTGKTIALGGSAYYALTFDAASGYDATFSVRVTNEDTGRAKSIAPNGLTAFKLYPGQSCIVYNSNNVWKVADAPERWRLTSAVTFYVAASGGSDTNTDGLNASAPFATIQKAVDTIFFDLDNNNTGPTIQLANGTYTETVVLVRGPVLGFHYIQFTGNTGTPANVVWQPGASGICLACRDYGIAVVAGIKFQSSAGGTTPSCIGLLASQWGNIDASNVVFGAFPNGNQVMVQSGGGINFTGSYAITGGAATHMYIYGPGHILTSSGITVTISGSLTYSTAFVQMQGAGGVISFDPAFTFSGAGAGSGTTGAKFSVDPLNKLDLNSVTLPGATAGSYMPGIPIQSSGSVSVGYGTGAGSTVTQGSNKSTAVQIDKRSGAITTNNAALNAGTEVGFTVTNNTVNSTDIPVLAVKSGASADSYHLGVDAVAAGSFRITITNVSGSNLSEALVINFAIIAGAAS